jgi:glyceraldehyde 3-phosphate dehydrogenase
MAIKVGINGYGRIGRLVHRAALSHPNIEIVAVNDVTDAMGLSHLMKYDSIHGTLNGEIKAEGDNIIINGKATKVLKVKDPADLPWKDLGVEVVLESTGLFTSKEDGMKHIKAGAKKVLISAPAKEKDVPTFVLGVNDNKYDPMNHNIITIGSCTTNCLAPIAKVLNDNFKIKRGFMTTVHAYTNDQRTLDQPHKDLRRARAAATSIIPSSTGAAKAISLVLPELEGKMDGVAMRVPVPDGSIVDLVAEVEKSVTKEEVNSAFKKYAEGPMKGYLFYTEDPIVSSDVIGNSHSSIVDGLSTMVMSGNFVKVFSWYDNEWGFSNRCAEMLEKLGM